MQNFMLNKTVIDPISSYFFDQNILLIMNDLSVCMREAFACYMLSSVSIPSRCSPISKMQSLRCSTFSSSISQAKTQSSFQITPKAWLINPSPMSSYASAIKRVFLSPKIPSLVVSLLSWVWIFSLPIASRLSSFQGLRWFLAVLSPPKKSASASGKNTPPSSSSSP